MVLSKVVQVSGSYALVAVDGTVDSFGAVKVLTDFCVRLMCKVRLSCLQFEGTPTSESLSSDFKISTFVQMLDFPCD